MYMEKLEKLKKPDVREKAMEHGVSYLFDEELIMLIIGSGNKVLPVNVMAKRMVQAIDDSDCSKVVDALLNLRGVGQGKALAVAAALELGKRRNDHLRAPIKCPSSIIPFVRSYSVNSKEHFLVITLNGGHEIIQIHVVAVGIVNRTVIHPREIFTEAIKENASAIILCHNHPSGDCRPSKEDVETTEMLLEGSRIMGIEILDHIIIDCENYFSFAENGLVFTSSLQSE